MNVKKQLNKIRDYVEELETLIDKQQTELHQYRLTAHKFVNQKITPTDAREEFMALLGDTMFIGGDFCGDAMEKMVDNILQPIEHEHQEYAKVVDENARLREALRWHPVSEKPKRDIKCFTPESENVILEIDKGYYPVTAYCSLGSGTWRELKNNEEISVNKRSRWCYIPEDNGDE